MNLEDLWPLLLCGILLGICFAIVTVDALLTYLRVRREEALLPDAQQTDYRLVVIRPT